MVCLFGGVDIDRPAVKSPDAVVSVVVVGRDAGYLTGFLPTYIVIGSLNSVPTPVFN